MKTAIGAALLFLVGVWISIALVGCASAASAQTAMRNTKNGPAVALVVRLVGGGPISPAQLTNIHQALREDILAAGYSFAPNTHAADFLVNVKFTPDALNPNGGHVAITGIEPNPMNRRGSAAVDDVSEETKELRRKIREIERWADAQAKSSS